METQVRDNDVEWEEGARKGLHFQDSQRRTDCQDLFDSLKREREKS